MGETPVKPGVFGAMAPRIREILADEKLAEEKVIITCRTLTPEEALGRPGRDDYPLQKGRERLMQAEIGGCAGQAFTDCPGNSEGSLKTILTLAPVNNFNRAAVVAALNAVLRKKGLAERTIHCRDSGPELCAGELAEYISRNHGRPRIAMIGLQPAMAEVLAAVHALRILDLDPLNEGKQFGPVRVETGDCPVDELERWADLFLVTGSTIINGTIDPFLGLTKPVVFFGTTIAGPAALLGLNRFCPRAT